MEKDLVEALGLTATTIKAMKLDDRMEQLGIDKKTAAKFIDLLVDVLAFAAACITGKPDTIVAAATEVAKDVGLAIP